ncbi:MAG TPA: glutamine--fructose-6-phosphate transaminase (isomerizing) [Nanoarchaeota archaeon]|nr:glutamine--fructose-6-phosphate transaminase (isomerizing) [Nanoarchaeota archaeon]
MCGIIGYIGNENASELVFKGLKRLEYRGYDSWGIAIKNGNEIFSKKCVGAIGDAEYTFPKSMVAIAHTRWATHGNVSEINAHPHFCCKKHIAVVHNGIIENYHELRKELEEKGHEFLSDTDTEVIAHLLEEFLEKGYNLEKALKETVKKLEGSYAILVIHKDDHAIYFAKKDSPLCIGIADHGFFVASDPVAFIDHTNNIIFLEDYEIGYVNTHPKIFDIHGKEKYRKPIKVDWKLEQAEKNGYEYYMEKEIFEQKETIIRAVSHEKEKIEKITKLIDNAFGVFFIGSGSSYYACLVSSYIFSKIAKKHVNVVDASEFGYYKHFLTPRTLIVAVSQSGETADVLDAVKKAKEKHAKILAITNVISSTLARISDYLLPMQAGPEICVVSTKTFTSQLALLTLLAYTLAGKYNEGKEKIIEAAKAIETILSPENKKSIEELAKKLKDKEHIFCLGRGVSYALALEAALKIKEVTYIHAEGFSGGFLKHGTIALIEKDTPCIVFAPKDETYKEIISNAQEVKARGAFVIGVSPENNKVFDYWIKVPNLKEATAIANIIPIQYLAYQIAKLKGYNPDRPRNLAKSVTVK